MKGIVKNALFCKSSDFGATEEKVTNLPELLRYAHVISLVNFVVLYFCWDFYQ